MYYSPLKFIEQPNHPNLEYLTSSGMVRYTTCSTSNLIHYSANLEKQKRERDRVMACPKKPKIFHSTMFCTCNILAIPYRWNWLIIFITTKGTCATAMRCFYECAPRGTEFCWGGPNLSTKFSPRGPHFTADHFFCDRPSWSDISLKGGIVALYPFHGHLPGFLKTHTNVCTVSKRSSLTGHRRLASKTVTCVFCFYRKYLWGKKARATTGNWTQASALTTEPSWQVLVEVTRMPIYNNALGSVPTQYFLLFKYLIPTLISFFFLSVFHSIFFPPSFSLSFLLFCWLLLFYLFFFLFFSFFSSYFSPHRFFPSFFICLLFTWYVWPTIWMSSHFWTWKDILYWHWKNQFLNEHTH